MAPKGKLQVIGAGLCRTGTLSTKAALEKLCDGQECHHYVTILEKPRDGKRFWDRVIDTPDEVDVDEWKTFFESRKYAACIDTPCAPHFEKLMKAFPEAKILLTVREPSSWYKSAQIFLEFMKKKRQFPLCILKYVNSNAKSYYWRLDKLKHLPYDGTGGECIANVLATGPDASEKFFNDWTEYVKRTVPKDRLLIFHVKEGWEPLCKFLDKPVPNEPFPWLNDAEWLRSKVAIATGLAWGLVILGPVCLIGLLYLCYELLAYLINVLVFEEQ